MRRRCIDESLNLEQVHMAHTERQSACQNCNDSFSYTGAAPTKTAILCLFSQPTLIESVKVSVVHMNGHESCNVLWACVSLMNFRPFCATCGLCPPALQNTVFCCLQVTAGNSCRCCLCQGQMLLGHLGRRCFKLHSLEFGGGANCCFGNTWQH